MIPFRVWIAFLLAVFLGAPTPSRATTIDPLTFEELVLGADFVGVVECVQAGGIVASYKIVESWKGPPVDTRITIRVAVNYWEPQFPITLCGERYFVTAFKEAPFRIVTTTSGGPVPLWWRQLPSDYRLPLFQGRELLKPGDDGLASKRTRAQKLLAMNPAEQEVALLNSLLLDGLLNRRRREDDAEWEKSKALWDRFMKLTTPEAYVTELLRIATEDKERARWVERILSKGGRAVALAQLEKLPVDKSPWSPMDLNDLITEIKDMVHPKVKPEPAATSATDKAKPLSEADLDKLRQAIAEGETAAQFGEAMTILTRQDPGPVAEWLVKWKNPNRTWRDADRGYAMGSYFAWRCGAERKKHLTRLLDAQDPYIRVAGGVYLCFEDPGAGNVALKELTKLAGDPGAWAAFTLARRGRKDAVPRALEVFKPVDQQANSASMASVPHRNLQKQVVVLLSNAARAGDVPQPSFSHDELAEEDEAKRWNDLATWWKQHEPAVVLRDPWLTELEKQKVD